MREGTSRSELAPSILPMPAERLFKTWSYQAEQVIGDLTKFFIALMRLHCTNSSFLHASTRSGTQVCIEHALATIASVFS
jgi:hypothetical protein